MRTDRGRVCVHEDRDEGCMKTDRGNPCGQRRGLCVYDPSVQGSRWAWLSNVETLRH